ncbi:MAG TPA: hypothetical protein VE820_02285 [Sphingomicrobium sp.]|jgi:hypothetical protein|nr:hypothetical protein [Sphingomicrobium sp.]
MSDDDSWFAPKRFGMGPGVPISWQGWALTLGFVAVTVGICLGLRNHPLQLVAVLAPVTSVFVVIAARKTRGGWHWRWGGDE